MTFTIDAIPPHIILTGPVDQSSTATGAVVSGEAEVGDVPSVTIQVYPGSTVGAAGTSVETIVVPDSAQTGLWSATVAGLKVGEYTVQAEQRDEAGNTGQSNARTFFVTSPPPPAAGPVASFTWIPAAPSVGQAVSLVSGSTDASSTISESAWDTAGIGPFIPAGPVLSTSFSTPGGHVVRLRVTDAGGLSGEVSRTIAVLPAPLILMQPFPIVRIAGFVTSYGVNLSLLTVEAPLATRVTISCHGGGGCGTKTVSRLALASASKGKGKSKTKPGTVLLAFRRFERSLRAGVVLEIRVSKPGEIGKYTSFAIRRNKLPVRRDACIKPTDPRPIQCPGS